jgi:DNA-binding CsgD family transcriptional regulator
LSLVRNSLAYPGRIHAVLPEIGLPVALAREQAELASRQVQVAESLSALTRMSVKTSRRSALAELGHVELLLGLDTVFDRLERLAEETTGEVLTFMPGGSQPAIAIQAARSNDARLLQRGGSIRTIGLDSIRNDQATWEYAMFIVELGGQFRVAPTLPPRMVVVDRTAALLPLNPHDSTEGALYVTAPGIVASLVALFEWVWETSTPVTAGSGSNDTGLSAQEGAGLSAQERALMRFLAKGLTDEAAAARLGVSPRTARRMVSTLMKRLGARSRFEAGVKAHERGWLRP